MVNLRLLSSLFLFLILLSPVAGFAQTPTVSVNPTLPADVFAGEGFCFTATLTNTGATGFGPYLLVVLPPEVTFDSASLFGGGSGSIVGTFPPAGQLTDPISGNPIAGPPGGTLVLVTLPIGSVVDGGLPLEVEICATLDTNAPIGIPLDLEIIPGFEFGDTATGDNGPILGSPTTGQVTPVLALFAKRNTASEDERTPGPSFPFEYVLTLDIANGSTLDNIQIQDALPPQIQWTGAAITVTPASCLVTAPNAPPTPGGSVSIDCASVLGTAGGPEVEIRIPAYVSDILDETSCATQSLVNSATADFDFMGTPAATLMTGDDQGPFGNGLLVTHAAVQKGATPQVVTPGDTVTYTHQFQVSDFASADSFTLVDTLPDGTTFVGTVSLVVAGAPLAITPSAVMNSPGPGQTTATWDIGAVAGTLAPGTTGTLIYTATVDQNYDPAGPNNGEPVRTEDPLTNTAVLGYSLTAGAGPCSNGTAETVEVQPLSIAKSIVDPTPVPSQFMPGDTVTFRLTMTVPSGDVQSVQFIDFLPLPVFDVADFNPLTDAVIAPPDTGDSTPTVSTNPATNAIIVDWSDVTVSPTRTVVLSIDLLVTISDEPFGDGLALTNLLFASSANTEGMATSDTNPVQINVGAPELTLVKGVSATSGSGVIAPAPAPPIDGNLTGADAGDTVTYVITVENIGSEPAFQVTVTDPPPTGLTGCSLDSVADGAGAMLATTGDLTAGLVLSSPLAENDGTPAGGGPPFGNDTALITVTCTLASGLQPGEVLTNTASSTWASSATATGTFPPVMDDATVTVAQPTLTKVISGVAPGYQAAAPFTANEPVHIGEIVTYTVTVEVPEGSSQSVTLFDQLDQGLAFVDVVSITADGGVTTDVAGGFAAVAAGATITNAGGGNVNLDRRLTLDFGTLTSSPDNDGSNNTLTILYRVVVLNSANNDRGDRRNNRADWIYDNPAGGTQSVRVGAPNVRIREASLVIDKQITPGFGDAGDTVQVNLTLDHSGASNTDAFDVVLTDTLPAGLTFAGSLAVAAGCTTAPTTGPSESSGTISASWSRFDDGETCTITFDATLDLGVSAGSVIENCAEVTWQSLRAADQPLPTAPANPFSAERTGDPSDPGGNSNLYLAEDCAEVMVADVAITKTIQSTSETHTTDGEIRLATTDLTIGEEVVFELIVQLPEGMISQLIVTDSLPFAPGVLEATAVRVSQVGGQISLPAAPTTLTLLDNNLGDGLADTAVVDFGGPVTNAPDGSMDEEDIIRIEIDAVVVNVIGNTSGDQLTNTALVQFGAGLDGSDTLDLDLVEPALLLTKQGDLSAGDAGDPVTFTLRIEHTGASTADAFDVSLTDSLPPELTFTGFVGSGLGTCTDTPDLGPSESTGTISANWSGFPRGAVCEVVFQASLAVSVMPGQTVTNLSNLEWRSLDTTVNTQERIYTANSSWPILISEPGLVKAVTATNVAETEDDQKGPAEDLTIGEEVTFQATATFIDGTTTNALIADQLPNGNVVLRIVSSRIVQIGSDLTVPNAAMGDAGDDCLPSCDTNSDGHRDLATWDLGDVVNQPDGVGGPDPNDELVIEVIAVVVNVVNNEGAPGVDLDERNTVTLTGTNLSIAATAPVDIVAPELTVEKTVVCLDADTSNSCEPGEPNGDPLLTDAGDRVIYEVVIEHTASSTAAAFGLTVNDLLPMAPGTAFVPGSVVAVVGVAPDMVSTGVGTLTLEWDDPFTLSTRYVIRYAVTIGAGAVAGETYPNVATLSWRSLEDNAAAEVREGMATDGAAVTIFAPTIVKQASSTSLDRTGSMQGTASDPDLTIGELVTYTLTAVFSEGDTTNVVITDTTQNDANGLLVVVGASVVSLGNNITTTLPGTPVLTVPDSVVFDFGTVTNAADGFQNADDTITLEVTAQVVNDDDPVPPMINTDSEVLTNTAVLTFGAGTMAQASATIDVVEPGLDLIKTMGPIVDGRVKVTVLAFNRGLAPGYDLEVTDLFDEAVFVASSALPVMLPPGFELVQSSDGSFTTVTIRVAGDLTMPTAEAILDPDETLPLMFTMLLQGGAMPPTTTIDNQADATLTSLPGPDDEERIYTAMATAQILAPSLMVTKTPSPLAAVPGQTITYTILIENMGDAPATQLVVFDTVPANTTSGVNAGWFVAPAPSTTACSNQAAGTVCFTTLAAPLGPGANTTTNFAVVVDNPLLTGVDMIFNQAQVDSAELPLKDSNIPQVPITAAPDLSVTKDDGGATATPGSTVTYTLTYDNIGNQTATGVVITETVPANTISATNPGWEVAPVGSGTACDAQPAGTVCVLAVGTVAVGGGATATFAVVVDSPKPSGVTQIANTATIGDDGSNGPDSNPSNNTGNDTTPVNAAPDLSLSKTDGGASSTPGATVSYTLTYANGGNQDATGVVITETVPANATSGINPGWEVAPVGSGTACSAQPAGTTCVLSIGNVSAGSGGNATFAVVIDNPLPTGVVQVANTATIGDDGSNGPDPNPNDNMGTDDTPITAAPDFSVSKTDGGITASAGDTITYTITYANNGNQDATGVVITETVPANAVSGTNPGWEVAPVGSGTACNNQPAATVCVLAIGNLAAGTGGMATFVVVADNPKPTGVTVIANTVTIGDDGSNGPDPTPVNNTGADDTPIDAAPDLSITKDDGGAPVIPGGTITYTLTYANGGTQDATGVVITETVPTNTTSGINPGWEVAPVGSGTACDNQPAATICVLSVGNVNAGDNGIATFVAIVDSPLPAGVEEISNAVSIGDDGTNGPDQNPNDNGDDDDTTVDATPDLNVSKDDGGATVTAGATVTYTITYGNTGDQDATGVVITETVPANTTSGTNPGWEVAPVGSGTACDAQPAGTSCVLSIGAVAAGTSSTATFAVVIDNPLPAGVTQVTNSITIEDDGTNGDDPNPDDNAGVDDTDVEAAPDLQVTKDDGGATATPGATLDYTLTYSNVGTQDATGVVLTEVVPVATTSGINPGWEVAPVGSGTACDAQPMSTICVFPVGTLAVGETAMASFQVIVDSPKPAGVEEISNTVSIEDDGTNGPDENPDDNSDQETTPAEAGPDLSVTKDDGGAIVVPGDTVTYTLSYQNAGDQDATGVELTETVPANTTSGANPGWEVAPVGSGVACDAQPAGTICIFVIGNLDAGDSGSATFLVVIDNPLDAGITSISNTVLIGDDGDSGPDQNPDDNQGDDDTQVDGTPVLDVFKSAEPPLGESGYLPGDTFTWTLELVNSGDQDVANLTLVDTLPLEVLYELESMVLDGIPLTDVAGDDEGVFDGIDTLTVDIPLVPAGGSVILTFATVVTGDDPDEDGMVFNQALVSDGDGNVVPSDDPDTMDQEDDPTGVVLAPISDIPTLGETGMLLLILLLMGLGTTLLRRSRREVVPLRQR